LLEELDQVLTFSAGADFGLSHTCASVTVRNSAYYSTCRKARGEGEGGGGEEYPEASDLNTDIEILGKVQT